jgi:glycosyltransferase involved in cell wall biosynthesis
VKLAVVIPFSEQKGGAERAFLDLLKYTDFSRVSWVVIFLNDGPLVEVVRQYPVVVEVLQSGRLRDMCALVKAVLAIAKIANMYQVNGIINWVTKAHLYGGLAALLARKPAIWYHHDMPKQGDFFQQMATLIPAQAILTVTQFTQASQQKIFPPRPTAVVHPGVDLDRFNPAHLPSMEVLRAREGLSLDVPVIGIVSRLQRWKGVHVLVEAMPKILAMNPDVHCVIVGGRHDLEADYERELHTLIEQLHLEQRVLMVGYQSNIPEWMYMMDIVVHASDNEPFGLVVVEAMSLAKPVIAGAQGGPTEIITSEVDGLLCPYGDVDSLAQCVLQYLDNPKLTSQIALKAQARAADFSLTQYADRFFQTVRPLLKVSCTDVV